MPVGWVENVDNVSEFVAKELVMVLADMFPGEDVKTFPKILIHDRGKCYAPTQATNGRVTIHHKYKEALVFYFFDFDHKNVPPKICF